MTNDDALPATEDPFELLGLPRTADEVEARRAYVRLAKRFRPETHPVAFRRVRRAWEDVRDWIRWVRGADAPEHDEPGDRRAAHLARAEAARSRAHPLWADAARGDVGAARARARAWVRDEPASEEAWTHRYLLEDVFVSREAATSVLEEAFASTAAPASVALRLLERSEREAVARGPECAWERLSRWTDRKAALAWMGLRVSVGLRDGRAGALAEEVLGPAFEDDARDDPALEHLAWVVMVGAAREAPERAAEIAKRYPQVATPGGWTPWEQLEVVREVAAGLSRWAGDDPHRGELARFVAVAGVLDIATVAPWASRLARDFRARPELWFDDLLDLDREAKDALGLFSRTIRNEPLLPPGPLSVRRVLAVLHGVEDRVRRWKRRRFRRAYLVAIVLVGAALGAGFRGWAMPVAIVSMIALDLSRARRRYEKLVRRPLLRLVLEHAVPPERLSPLIERNRRTLDALHDLQELVREDEALEAVYWARRMAEIAPAHRAATPDETG